MTAPLWSRLEIWDGPYLHYWARKLGIAVPPFVVGGDLHGEEASVGQAEHGLLRRLARIVQGDRAWRAYEEYCQEVLNFLFCTTTEHCNLSEPR